MTLTSNDTLTSQLKSDNIYTWEALVTAVKHLPYGRNTNREYVSLVWKEQQGTCSSKHAFLKYVADLNDLPNVDLILGIYKMNNKNTPKIGDVLVKNNLDYMPEAHCYLQIDGKRLDYTSATSSFNKIKDDILLERNITPEQVATFKVDFHKTYLKDWIIENDISFSFEKLWEIREDCIANLSA